jgi:hypothetical protein
LRSLAMHRSCVLLALALVGHARAEEWRYVVPKASEPFDHPSMRAVALSPSKPAELKERVRYRGKPRYTRLVYGQGRAAPVTVVVDEVGPGDVDLYLDADRDNEITKDDLVKGEKLAWRADLNAVLTVGEDTKPYPRAVAFRYNRITRTLAVATRGYVEGKAKLGGKEVRVRRTDGDANGLFADPQDRVWIDADGDGAWDAGSEEFLFAPILRVGEQRVALRADVWGRKLELAPLSGTGTLKLRLPESLKAEKVREVAVTLQSRDGVVATVRQAGGEAVVPAGDYRVSSLLLTLDDPAGGPSWGYVFTDNGGKAHKYRTLAKGATLEVEPVGRLDFSVESAGACKAGETLSAQMRLYTGDGLLIERAYRGEFSGGPFNQGCHGGVALMKGGKSLASASSGFA